jgi:hypothetical protein
LPSSQNLKVLRAIAAFPMILRAQATTSLTQQKFHMEIKRNGTGANQTKKKKKT